MKGQLYWLNAVFCRHFWSVIGRDLFSVFMESLKKGTFPVSLHRAGVTLLPKKGDLEDIRCWHPVSLLRVDYNILSKSLTNIIQFYISSVIHADQSYCIPERTIFDNIFWFGTWFILLRYTILISVLSLWTRRKPLIGWIMDSCLSALRLLVSVHLLLPIWDSCILIHIACSKLIEPSQYLSE